MELGPRQRLWVDALKSGKYKQGKGKLRVKDKFCCLGVACDLFKDELNLQVHPDDKQVYFYNGDTGTLPLVLVSHLGFHNRFGYGLYHKSLMEMNDYGNSFENIAKIIEDNPQSYFKESK